MAIPADLGDVGNLHPTIVLEPDGLEGLGDIKIVDRQ
jgi:hypothetical protein